MPSPSFFEEEWTSDLPKPFMTCAAQNRGLRGARNDPAGNSGSRDIRTRNISPTSSIGHARPRTAPRTVGAYRVKPERQGRGTVGSAWRFVTRR